MQKGGLALFQSVEFEALDKEDEMPVATFEKQVAATATQSTARGSDQIEVAIPVKLLVLQSICGKPMGQWGGDKASFVGMTVRQATTEAMTTPGFPGLSPTGFVNNDRVDIHTSTRKLRPGDKLVLIDP